MASAMMASTPLSSHFSTTKDGISTNRPHMFPSKRVSSSMSPRAASSIPYQPAPVSVDYLESEFGGRGVSFGALGDGCVVNMSLVNGSAAIVMLPAAVVTSYKAAMWHRGTVELIHTLVDEDDLSSPVRGGLSLHLRFTLGDCVSWSPTNWVVHRITGSSRSSIQVELLNTNSRDMIEVRNIISLRDDELSSKIVITNSGSSPAQLSGFMLSHLRASSPEATSAIGLAGSDFFVRPPFTSEFSVIPPDFGTVKDSPFGKLMDKLSFWNQRDDDKKKDEQETFEGEEDENHKNLREEMSLIYTSAPQSMTINDRGRRNSVVVGRQGFEELYLFSPGSTHEIYGKYAYLCVGSSAMLKPITVAPGQVVELGQALHNPNL